jgi:hypothetical protein
MARMPAATWSPSPNHGGARRDYRWIVVHRTAGSFPGDLALLRRSGSNTGATFYVRRTGQIHQLHDTTSVPWTSRDANPRSVTIEFEGTASQGLTVAQEEAGARIFAFVHKTHGTALVAVKNPATQGGVSYHRHGAMFGLDWGRTACPGDQVVAQIPGMVARARAIVNPPPAPPKEPAVPQPKYDDFKSWYADWFGPVQSLIHWWTKIRPVEQTATAVQNQQLTELRTAVDALSTTAVSLAARVAALESQNGAPTS